MVSARIQRRIEKLLDEADEAVATFDWDTVRQCAEAVLRLDPENPDAQTFLSAANPGNVEGTTDRDIATARAAPLPASFADGRYAVSEWVPQERRKRPAAGHRVRGPALG